MSNTRIFMVQAIATPIKLQWRRITFISSISIGLLLWSSCHTQTNSAPKQNSVNSSKVTKLDSFHNSKAVTHVFVALCDNKFQGIIPVPKAIGNGKDAELNLYWGCDYGLRAFFKKYTEWKLVQTIKQPAAHVIERCVFQHKTKQNYFVADAYDGEFIKLCTTNFLAACAGKEQQKIVCQKDTIGIGGNAQLLAYIGHDGLMDFRLDTIPTQQNKNERQAIILACKSKQFFASTIQKIGAKPLLWTTQLMCPEAYTFDAALTGWLNKETDKQIHLRASAAYSKYQHCSVKAASGLLATGY